MIKINDFMMIGKIRKRLTKSLSDKTMKHEMPVATEAKTALTNRFRSIL